MSYEDPTLPKDTYSRNANMNYGSDYPPTQYGSSPRYPHPPPQSPRRNQSVLIIIITVLVVLLFSVSLALVWVLARNSAPVVPPAPGPTSVRPSSVPSPSPSPQPTATLTSAATALPNYDLGPVDFNNGDTKTVLANQIWICTGDFTGQNVKVDGGAVYQSIFFKKLDGNPDDKYLGEVIIAHAGTTLSAPFGGFCDAYDSRAPANYLNPKIGTQMQNQQDHGCAGGVGCRTVGKHTVDPA